MISKMKSMNIKAGLLVTGSSENYVKVELNKSGIRLIGVDRPEKEGLYLSKVNGRILIPYEIKKAYNLFNVVDVIFYSESNINMELKYSCIEDSERLYKEFAKGLFIQDNDVEPDVDDAVVHYERKINKSEKLYFAELSNVSSDALITCHLGEKVYMEVKPYCGEDVMTFIELIERYGKNNQYLGAYKRISFRHVVKQRNYIHIFSMFRKRLSSDDIRIDKLIDGRVIVSGMKEICELSEKITDPINEQQEKAVLCEDCASEEDQLKTIIKNIKDAIGKKTDTEKTVEELKKEVLSIKQSNMKITEQMSSIENLLSSFRQSQILEMPVVVSEQSDYFAFTEEILI